MISSEPAEEMVVITGATLFTWGNLASTPPTLIGMGAPVRPAMNEDPGGRTKTSAPMPAVRVRPSCSIPRQSPTIRRISVTSSATATMLISERTGRRTRFPMIMRFIMSFPGTLPALVIQHPSRAGIRLIEEHHVSSRRLLQRKLVVSQRLVDVQFDDVQSDVVILPRTLDLNRNWEHNPGKVFVVQVVRVGGDVSLLVIDPLPVRQQVAAAELNPARQIPALRTFADDRQFVIRLLDAVLLRVEDSLIAVFEHRNLVRADFRDQQRVVDVLRTHILQALVRLV